MTDTSTSTNHTSRSSADRINQWVAVAAGVLGILVTVLSIIGFNVSNARDEAAGTAEGLQRELDDANRMVGSLRSDNTLLQRNLASANADNEKLQADIQSLSEQLKAAGETPSNAPSSAEPSASNAPVRHTGEVTLAENGDLIDLNAASTNVLWESETGSGYDLARLEDGQVLLGGADSLPLEGETATYETCSTRSGYAGGDGSGYDPAALQGNQCFRLHSGRFATISFVKGDKDRVTLAITTWEKE